MFQARPAVFRDAARLKIGRAGLPPDANLHLTSRDIRQALEREPAPGRGP